MTTGQRWLDRVILAGAGLCIAALVGLLAFGVCRLFVPEAHHGVVVDRSFVPGGCDTGTSVGANGKVGIVTSCHGDKWYLVVKEDDGRLDTVQVDASIYETTKDGDRYDTKESK